MPKLSIIIPSKNEEKGLPQTLASLREQTFQDFEIIVADNNSTDRTREIAKQGGARISEGGMPSAGRNRGAEHALGLIFAFVDADTVFPDPQFLTQVVQEMEQRKLQVAAPAVAPMSDRRVDQWLYQFYNWYARLLEPVWPHAPGFCMFATKEAHEKINGFDETVEFAEDHDYAQRAKRAGLRYGLLRTPKAVQTSIRRFEKDGRVRIALVYLWTEIRMMLIGPYKKPPFKYEMGGETKK